MSVTTLTISLDRHRLVTTKEGNLLSGSGPKTFLIYDLQNETTKEISVDQADEVVTFLGSKPSVIIQQQNSASTSRTEDGPFTSSSVKTTSSSSDGTSSSNEIWIKNSGKPSAIDLKARDDLLKLYGNEKYQNLFNDKKTAKKKVWDQLAQDLIGMGYSFGERDAGKVCSQKWRNMEGETLKVLAAVGPKNSGGGQVKKPEYFDNVCDIIKDKAKACPKNLMDSLEPSTLKPIQASNNVQEDEKLSDEDAETETQEQGQEARSCSPFMKVKATSRPKSTKVKNSEILNFLKEDAAKREKQNKDLLKFLQKKAKRDDRRKRSFLSVLQDIAGKKKQNADAETDSSNGESESDSDEEQGKK